MKVLVCGVDGHYGSSIVINDLMRDKKVEIIGLIESTSAFSKKGYVEAFFKAMSRSGMAYTFSKITTYLAYRFGTLYSKVFKHKKKRKLFTNYELSQDHGVPLHYTDDVNSEKTVGWVKELKPDLIVTAVFNQILKKEIMDIPTYGCINLHPGPLPYYRGLDAAFWVVFNKEKYSGITVHKIDDGIDTGRILAFKRFKISRNDTPFSVMVKASRHGKQLIHDAIEKIKEGSAGFKNNKKISKYFSLPTKDQVASVRKRRKLFTLRKAFNLH